MAAPLIGDTHYCGTDIPDMMESTGHNLFVRFKTDYDVGKRGFEIVVDAGKITLIYYFVTIFGCNPVSLMSLMINIRQFVVPEEVPACTDWFPEYCGMVVMLNDTDFYEQFCDIFGPKFCQLSCNHCRK